MTKKTQTERVEAVLEALGEITTCAVTHPEWALLSALTDWHVWVGSVRPLMAGVRAGWELHCMRQEPLDRVHLQHLLVGTTRNAKRMLGVLVEFAHPKSRVDRWWIKHLVAELTLLHNKLVALREKVVEPVPLVIRAQSAGVPRKDYW